MGVMGVGGHKLWGGDGWWKIDGRRWEGCGPGMPGPYGVVKGKRLPARRCTGGMNPSPTDCREREIVGWPALRPPRACMGVRVVSGYPCRGRCPRRPSEGSRPLPTMWKIRGWLWESARAGHARPLQGGGRLAGAGRERRGRDESLPYGVRGTGDCRAACPQAAAGVYGRGDDFGSYL